MKTALCFCLHDDISYLGETIDALRAATGGAETPPAYAFVSRLPWHAHPGAWAAAAAACEALGMTVLLGDWNAELEQRQAAIDHLLALGHTHALIPDGDEIIEPRLLGTLLSLAESDMADRVYVCWDTYWKTPEYVIRPRERFCPCYLIDLRVARPTGGRNFEGGRALLLGPEYGIVHQPCRKKVVREQTSV